VKASARDKIKTCGPRAHHGRQGPVIISVSARTRIIPLATWNIQSIPVVEGRTIVPSIGGREKQWRSWSCNPHPDKSSNRNIPREKQPPHHEGSPPSSYRRNVVYVKKRSMHHRWPFVGQVVVVFHDRSVNASATSCMAVWRNLPASDLAISETTRLVTNSIKSSILANG
jgi:hypothetical protein